MSNTAVAYIRVSTEEQVVSGVSLDAQHERIRAYCTMAGLDLIKVIREEGVSASKALAARPGGSDLVSVVAWKQAGHIVALKLDRLFRDAEDALKQTKAWDRAGVTLHLVDMGGQALNTASAMGRFFLSMMAGFAELERNLIAERTRIALAHKRAHGKVYGPVPYGFVRKGSMLLEDNSEQQTLSLVRGWRAAGWTYRRIAGELNSRGTATKFNGARWHASTVRQMLRRSELDMAA